MKRCCVFTILTIVAVCGAASFLYAQNAKPDDTTFKKATKYFFEKKYEMAELLLQETIKQNPENAEAYAYLGDIFLEKKRYDAAIDLYKKAIDLSQQNGENYFRLGQAYYYKQLGQLAIDNFQKAYAADKNIKFAYYHIGLTYLVLLRDKQKTIANWENYLSIAPEDPQYEKIRRAVELLKDPQFEIPPVGSNVPIEEALHLGGTLVKSAEPPVVPQKAGGETVRTSDKVEGIYRDDDL